MEEEHQEQKTAEDKCQSNSSGISIHVPTQGTTPTSPPKGSSQFCSGHPPSCEVEPTQGTMPTSPQKSLGILLPVTQMEEEHQEQKTAEDQRQTDNNNIYVNDGFEFYSGSPPLCDGEPTQGTKPTSQLKDQPSRHSRRVIARPTTSPSGQNGQAEPAVEMSEEEAVCAFCNCILKVGKVMFKRKCNCQRDPPIPPILAHERCTTQPNESCNQCKEPIQNIRMTLQRAPVAGKKKGFACFFC